MRNLLITAITVLIFIGASCKKNDASYSSSITGNWHIISDSTWSSGIGPYGTPSGHKYIGIAGDFFNFTNKGKLYVKEGTVKLDTADYTVAKDTLKLKYDYLYEGGVTITGAIGSYIITTLNARDLTLTENFLTPGGIIFEQIKLNK